MPCEHKFKAASDFNRYWWRYGSLKLPQHGFLGGDHSKIWCGWKFFLDCFDHSPRSNGHANGTLWAKQVSDIRIGCYISDLDSGKRGVWVFFPRQGWAGNQWWNQVPQIESASKGPTQWRGFILWPKGASDIRIRCYISDHGCRNWAGWALLRAQDCAGYSSFMD